MKHSLKVIKPPKAFYFPIPELTRKSKLIYDCNKCGIKNKSIGIQEIEPIVGEDYQGIVILTQCISEDDNAKNKLLVNSSGTIVRSTARKNGINLAKQAAILPALACYTNKKPTETQFKCCRSKLAERLEALKPKLIICLGDMAFKFLFNLKNKNSMSKIRNRLIPNYEFNCMVFVTYNCSNILNNTRKRDLMDDIFSYTIEQALKWDLTRAVKMFKNIYIKRKNVTELLNARKILEGIVIDQINDMYDVKEAFKQIKQRRSVAFDYETTNLSPYDEDFSAVYFAFGSHNHAWVFHEDLWKDKPLVWEIIKKNLIEILTSKRILKVIQNSKFEDLCSRYFLNIERINNIFCTMLATHVVDERRGCTGQDFQNLVRFGIPPYSEEIKRFLITDDKLGEKQNKIREAPVQSMVKYNGLDVITCYNNFLLLDGDLLDSYPTGRENYELLLRGHEKFANFTKRGIHIGTKEFEALEEYINYKMQQTMKAIELLPEVVSFNKHLAEALPEKLDKDEILKNLSIDSIAVNKPKRRKLSM